MNLSGQDSKSLIDQEDGHGITNVGVGATGNGGAAGTSDGDGKIKKNVSGIQLVLQTGFRHVIRQC